MVEVRISVLFQDSFQRGAVHRKGFIGRQSAEIDDAGDKEQLSEAVDRDLMLHGFMLFQSGIPVIYSGDEVAELNDYSYKDDPEKAADSRYLHRGRFPWELAANRKISGTLQNRLFPALMHLERLRRSHSVFDASVPFWTIDTHTPSVLGLVRENEQERLVCLYNFSGEERTAWIREGSEEYRDLITGELLPPTDVRLPAFGCCWLCKAKP